jgi:NAD(P)-dependent dehydrogenase (short-subunit alcohol dehydrogenase family)
MVSIQEVRSELSTLKRLGPGLVAVFVGGTSGIGEGTARAFVQHADKPKIYLIGRKQEEADRIIGEFQKLNAGSQTKFIKSDVSLVKSVDQVCEEIKQQEEKLNLLVISAGYLTTQGRNGE